MGETSSALRIGAQAFFCITFALALAVNLIEATAGVSGWSKFAAVLSVVAIELGVCVGAGMLGRSVTTKQWGVAAVFGIIFAITGTSAIRNGIAHSWRKHDAARQVATQHVAEYQARADRVRQLELQLASYATVRSTEDVAQAVTRCGQCKGERALRDELSRAQARDGLRTTLADARAEVGVAPASTTSPDADMLERTFGISPADSQLYVAWLHVLLLQLSAPLAAFGLGLLRSAAAPAAARNSLPNWMQLPAAAGAVAAALAGPTPAAAAAPAQRRPEASADAAATAAAAAAQRRAAAMQRLPRRAQQVVAAVDAARGELRGTTRRLAKALDMHPVTLGHAYREAAAAGLLHVEANKKGVVLRRA